MWKTIEQNPKYAVSDQGEVMIKSSGKLMSLWLRNGYPTVTLDGRKEYVHRLVAGLFISNPENKKEVNHIDGVRVNNNIHNLEWVTSKENTQHCLSIGRFINRPIIQFSLSGEFIQEFEGQNDAARKLNISQGNIHSVLIGKRKKTFNSIWKFKDQVAPTLFQ